MSVAVIRVSGLRKEFAVAGSAVVAVGGIGLEVARGEIFGFLGPMAPGRRRR